MSTPYLWQIRKRLLMSDIGKLTLPDDSLLVVIAPRSLAAKIPLSILSDKEYARMRRYRSSEDQDRSLVAHGLKRTICSALTKHPPDKLCFSQNSYGKPYLRDGALSFSLSHSDHWISLAFGTQVNIGVDVEQTRQGYCAESFPMIYHPAEKPPEDTQCFFSTWTLKEAVTKAAGCGLFFPFNQLHLERLYSGFYKSSSMGSPWYVRHGLLPGDAHLSIASNNRLKTQNIFLYAID